MSRKDVIDYKNFDAEKELARIRQGVKKPNLLLCGVTGAGKSSLVKDIFDHTLENAPEVGEGLPVTQGVHRYESDSLGVVLHDSEGYEIGSDKQKHYYDEVIGYVDRLNSANALNGMEQRIHEVWYCVNAGAKKFHDTDADVIGELRRRGLPVCVVMTKVDVVSERELTALKEAILSQFPEMSIFTYCSRPVEGEAKYSQRIATYEALCNAGYVQKEELVHWSFENLGDSLREGLLSSVKGSLKEKQEHIRKVIVPACIASAVAIVVGNAFVPVPFTDSAALMAMQTTMAVHILNVYNISSFGDVAKSLIGSTGISLLGKTLAGSLAKAIPLVGTAVAITVNSAVAATLTGAVGYAVDELSYVYLSNCVKNGGTNGRFADWFNSETLKAAIENAQVNFGDVFKAMGEKLAEQFRGKDK